MKNTLFLVYIACVMHSAAAAAYSSYLDGQWYQEDTTTTTDNDTPTDQPTIDENGLNYNFPVTLPQNNCGYSNVDFNTSLNNQLASNDTVWFYDTNLPSNCGPQEDNLGCVSEMYMTGPYSFLGYVPYTVWYYFNQIGSNTMVNLYYNYNNSATHMIASVPCNVDNYPITISKCMFSEELYQYQFFTVYQFNFYLTCNYDTRNAQVYFNLDQESLTCGGGSDCKIVRNRFNLVNFNNWNIKYANVDNGVDHDFCIPSPPPPPESTEIPDITITPTITATVVDPTETSICKSCHDGTLVININNSAISSSNNNNVITS